MKSFVLLVFFLGFQFPAIGKFIVEIPKLDPLLSARKRMSLYQFSGLSTYRGYLARSGSELSLFSLIEFE